ncbi:GntR family transcriptional regulator [Herbiconiux sp. CPCC 205763]|uniref:GntR family transcriptional regulator n=1 Tax=Herbiconiux aconitum TaxID=2970913 RepID=A0ABT2GLB5_9MICO|nr:GntR family transcriptional regulator [Herbiconiux aconitum]MCS5717007.1 GntR family transcriptional regulator [Herbiconiux aconitum]
MDDRSRFLPARRALVDDVYDAVLGLLMDQEIAPGSRVSIDGIARQLDVSPTPVREALTRLEAEGLVVKRPLKGYTATPLLDAEGLRQLFELRTLLEPPAAGLAARRTTAEFLDALDALSRRMAEGARGGRDDDRFRDYRAFADQDAEFHRLIAQHSGNPLLADAIGRLRSHLHLYRLYFAHGIAEDAAGEHDAVLRALHTGDADAAEEAMREHIALSYRRIAARVDES